MKSMWAYSYRQMPGAIRRDTFGFALLKGHTNYITKNFPRTHLAAALWVRGISRLIFLCSMSVAGLEADAMDKVAAESETNLAQIALAWINAQPGIAAPIASVSRAEQLGDLIAAADLKLTAEQLASLSSAGMN